MNSEDNFTYKDVNVGFKFSFLKLKFTELGWWKLPRKNKSCLTQNRTTWINVNRIIINCYDYYNPIMDYYISVMDYYNPVIDCYNLLLSFEPCLNPLGLILILCKTNINLIYINSSYGLIIHNVSMTPCHHFQVKRD